MAKGFTLIETLIPTLVLVTGLAAVAGLFSYAAQTNLQNRQRTAATVLLQGKLEELRNARVLPAGKTTENIDQYLRVSTVEPGTPHRITVTVYGLRRNAYYELARATMLAGRKF